MNWLRAVLKSADFWVALFLVVLVSAASTLLSVQFQHSLGAEVRVTTLNELQKQQVATFIEMNKLLTTLATLAMGGLGAFVFNRYKDQPLPRAQAVRVLVTILFVGLSLFFGYVSHERLIAMFDAEFFNLFSPLVSFPTRAQFWTFLIAVLYLAAFVFTDLTRSSANASKETAGTDLTLVAGVSHLLAQGRAPGAETLDKSLAVAKQRYRIELGAGAKAIMAKQYADATPRLLALIAYRNPEEEQLFLETVVGQYLGELRDAGVTKGTLERGAPATLDAADLENFTLMAFLRKYLPSEAVPKAFLVVESEPQGGNITINGAFKGLTNRTFVVPPGQHRVEVSVPSGPSCSGPVRLDRDHQVVFQCPRR